jgi:hypothetical protein
MCGFHISSWLKDRESDNGLYVLDGRLQFYDFGIGGDFKPGTNHRVLLERDRETKEVRGYLDGREVFKFIDSDGHAVFAKSKAWLFVDDVQTSEEQTSGSLTRLRIWDAPLMGK